MSINLLIIAKYNHIELLHNVSIDITLQGMHHHENHI